MNPGDGRSLAKFWFALFDFKLSGDLQCWVLVLGLRARTRTSNFKSSEDNLTVSEPIRRVIPCKFLFCTFRFWLEGIWWSSCWLMDALVGQECILLKRRRAVPVSGSFRRVIPCNYYFCIWWVHCSISEYWILGGHNPCRISSVYKWSMISAEIISCNLF